MVLQEGKTIDDCRNGMMKKLITCSLPRGSIIVWRLGRFCLILDAEYGCCKEISAIYGFFIATRLQKLEFKRAVDGFSLTAKNLLLGNRYFLSGLRIVVTVRSSQIVDSDKLPWNSGFIYMK